MASNDYERTCPLPTNHMIQQQLQDIIEAQQKVIDELKLEVEAKEETVQLDHYEAVIKELEDERIAHSKTKSKLMDTEDRLEFALGEIDILKKQIQREKTQFERTFGLMKTKAIKETVKSVELENKCHAIKKEVKKTETELTDKEQEIKDLEEKLHKKENTYKQQLNEMSIQLQQELYIANVLQESERKKSNKTKKA